jgi:two-component system, NarL family, sensor histidine kinase UhpB
MSSLALTAQEEERRRLARELHDDTAQSLASLLVRLRVLERTEEPAELRGRLHEFRDLIAGALDDVRRMAMDLRPTLLDDLGLAPAVEAHTRDVAARWKLAVRVQNSDIDDRLPTEIELVAYRIVQEALVNAVKHASATVIDVSLTQRGRMLRIAVQDNGRGFAVAETLASRERGLGLFGMEERAALVGGAFEVASAPGQGTTVTAIIPVDKAEERGRRTPISRPRGEVCHEQDSYPSRRRPRDDACRAAGTVER